ncbi:hypothetical protein GJ496_010059, partial [Pomphorhynchus laevis]
MTNENQSLRFVDISALIESQRLLQLLFQYKSELKEYDLVLSALQ